MNGHGGVIATLVKQGKRKVFRWCIRDVIENCNDFCDTCTLKKDCAGKAHDAEGFVPASDVRIMRERVSDSIWGYQVLCDHESAAIMNPQQRREER